MAIAECHIEFGRQNPFKVAEVARILGVGFDGATALAIADQLCEEFELSPR